RMRGTSYSHPKRAARCAALSAIACSLLFLSRPGAAQNTLDNDPDGAQGYVNNVFHQSSVDSINLYNGQLTIPIALGPSYPVGPKLKLQLYLTYNSRVWDYSRTSAFGGDTLRMFGGDPALGIGWTFTMGAIKGTAVGFPFGEVPTFCGPD